MPQLKLTNKQYKDLVKLTFIGEWVLNSYSVEPIFKDESILTQHVFSKNSTFNLSNWFNKFEDGKYELKEEIVLSILPVVDQFSEYKFWDLLIEKLALRDLKVNLSDINVEELEDEELELMEDELIENYTKKFKDGAFENLKIFDDSQINLN